MSADAMSMKRNRDVDVIDDTRYVHMWVRSCPALSLCVRRFQA